jgi:starvation-inducible DNA-binding protein
MDTPTQTDRKAMQAEIATRMNTLLSTYQVYYQNLRGFHWNIQGKDFFELHEKFEVFYTETAQVIDELAERILAMESKPMHTFSDYLDNSRIQPAKNVTDGNKAMATIADNLRAIVDLEKDIVPMAQDAADIGTETMLTDLILQQEKTLWMLRSYLKL